MSSTVAPATDGEEKMYKPPQRSSNWLIPLIKLGRWSLGLWFFTVGVAYRDILEQPPYTGGLAGELAKAFFDSGLAGCGAVLLMVAGVLIIFDRLTVLALMTGISVTVPAAFWALLTMRVPPIAVVFASLSLSTLLLMGYWSYFRQLITMRTPSTIETGEEQNPALRRVTIYSHYIWGGWWVISGLFHFVTGPIIGSSPLAVQLIMALLNTGLYEVIKAIEAIGGVAVLSRRWAPLLLVLNLPVTLAVMYWDALLEKPGHVIGVGVAILTLTTTCLLLRSYRNYLHPLMTWKPVAFN